MAGFFGRNFATGLLVGCIVAVGVAAAAVTYERYDTKTLKRTVRRDAVYCGVNSGLPGFSADDGKGNWSGFDVDFCRAIAAAIFDDPKKVKFIPLDAKERFDELGKRKVDVLARNSTWTMSRETEYYLHFAGVSYYDGQGFMVPRARNVDSALALDGSKVCVQSDTTTELNLADYFRANNMKFEAKKFGTVDDVFKAYDSGQCDTLTADVSQLYALRQKAGKPGDHAILADVLGIDSKNIGDALKSKKPDVMRFVGTEGEYGEELGLTKDWAVRIVRHVGNYGEVYERNVGSGSKLGIPRGLNQLWNAGGILYAPPIR
jgi:general L-amino acid transport system substrate-binding protein